MFSASAELYDLIYSGFKDYPAEAAQVAALIRAAHPTARLVLDVGCGTAEHARLLTANHSFTVDGLDRDPAFVRIARRKPPEASIYEADMMEFGASRTIRRGALPVQLHRLRAYARQRPASP